MYMFLEMLCLGLEEPQHFNKKKLAPFRFVMHFPAQVDCKQFLCDNFDSLSLWDIGARFVVVFY